MTDEFGLDGITRRPRMRGRKRFPAFARRVRKEGPAGLAEPVLVHLERAEEQIREGRKIDQNGHFRKKVIRYRDLYGKKD